jgi:hypothetical protein
MLEVRFCQNNLLLNVSNVVFLTQNSGGVVKKMLIIYAPLRAISSTVILREFYFMFCAYESEKFCRE